MLGKILKIDGKIIIVENLKKVSLINIIGYYVIFEDMQKLVGEIVFVNENEFHIVLLGEIKNDSFIYGVENFPPITSTCRVINKKELEAIIGAQDILLPLNLLLGKSTIFDGFNITVNVNDFFSNHFAIVGNTGSGKSCGVSRILQNLFAENKPKPTNSHIILFDVYGEYKSVVNELNNHSGINTKTYTTSTADGSVETIKIPPYLLEVDDLVLLLNLKDPELVNILEKTLIYVKIFKGDEAMCLEYKNGIIAQALIEILTSGRTVQQVSDQSIAFLSKYYTPKLNLETTISQPGYNRTIRQCLYVDPQGKIAALEPLVSLLQKYSNIDIKKINLLPTNYTIEDLYDALEFAIISEGALNNEGVYEKLNGIKNRLYSIIISDNKKLFEYHQFVGVGDYIKDMFTSTNGEKIQIIDINFDGIDNRLAKVIVKILVKMCYNYTTSLEKKGSYPINVIIEEAHRYITKDDDVKVIGYNIFDKVAKEGRKYGLILGLVTQRLCELSETALSQCSNFIVFKMYYPDDIDMVSKITTNITIDMIEKVKSLRPGSALLFGNAFKIPLITQFDIPNPMPTSLNVDIHNTWYE